ncbi:TIGR03086 family metal-binding protein [Nocardia asteroides]|uniref:TIGR03086 family metal-binding protein n=1 Tax=Nocardia asteroides TaxID=1824 RepID=UPI003434C245
MPTISENDLLLGRHRRAVQLSVDAVEAAAGAPLTLETPCVGWDLRALLAHMATQNRGFAAAARGEDDPAVWQVRPAVDPIGDYPSSAEEVVAAFAGLGSFDRALALPEIPPGRIPAGLAVGFHLIDSVVHAWDVARTVGHTIDLDPDLAPTALRIAEAVPTGAFRELPGAAFAPAVDGPADATLDRILRLLGRSPQWRPGGGGSGPWPTMG